MKFFSLFATWTFFFISTFFAAAQEYGTCLPDVPKESLCKLGKETNNWETGLTEHNKCWSASEVCKGLLKNAVLETNEALNKHDDFLNERLNKTDREWTPEEDKEEKRLWNEVKAKGSNQNDIETKKATVDNDGTNLRLEGLKEMCKKDPENCSYSDEDLEIIRSRAEQDLQFLAPSESEELKLKTRELYEHYGFTVNSVKEPDGLDETKNKYVLKAIIRNNDIAKSSNKFFDALKSGDHNRLIRDGYGHAHYNPDDSRAWLALADAENRARNYGYGLRNAKWALGLDPKDPYTHLITAQSKYGLGDYPGAVDGARKAGELDPGLSNAHALEASALYSLGDYEGARDAANKALELDPNNDAARGVKSFAQQKLHDPMSASASAADLANLWKRKEMSGAGLGGEGYWAPGFGSFGPGKAGELAFAEDMTRLMKMGDFDKAITLADRIIKKNPKSAVAHNHKAWAQLRKGDARGALSSATKAIKLDPRNAASAHYTRAMAHEKIGNLNAMLEDLQLAASLNPKYAGRLAEGKAKYETLGKEGEVASPILAPFLKKIGGIPVWLVALLLASIAVSGFALFGRPKKRGRRTAVFRSLLRTFSSPGPLGAGISDLGFGETLQGNKYEIEKEIGRGGMGVVYAGYEPALDRKVAIKKLREEVGINSREKENLLQEARLVAALQHPNIISIHSIFEESGQVYLVFEYVQGKTVDQILDQKRRLALGEAKNIVKPTCDALDYAHSRKVIHRDLKPSNIMLTDDGHVKVMDFGVARMAKETVSRYSRTDVAGSPAYMAPEQELGKVRRESDIYGLGVCLYEMITGQLPFLGPSFLQQKMDKDYPKPTEVVSSLPAEINPLLEKALSPNPEERYRLAGDFWRALEAIPETDRARSRAG